MHKCMAAVRNCSNKSQILKKRHRAGLIRDLLYGYAKFYEKLLSGTNLTLKTGNLLSKICVPYAIQYD